MTVHYVYPRSFFKFPRLRFPPYHRSAKHGSNVHTALHKRRVLLPCPYSTNTLMKYSDVLPAGNVEVRPPTKSSADPPHAVVDQVLANGMLPHRKHSSVPSRSCNNASVFPHTRLRREHMLAYARLFPVYTFVSTRSHERIAAVLSKRLLMLASYCLHILSLIQCFLGAIPCTWPQLPLVRRRLRSVLLAVFCVRWRCSKLH